MVKINKLKRKPRILFDMDDVLVDFLGGFIEEYNNEYKTNVDIKECDVWNLDKVLTGDIYKIMNRDNFIRNLKPKGNSIEVIKRLIDKGYDVFIVSACSPKGYIEKLLWLEEYMPFFNRDRLIPCSEKSAIWGDILIDDKISNLDDFSKIGEGVIFDMPHNKTDKSYKRFKSLEAFEEYIDDKFMGVNLNYNII